MRQLVPPQDPWHHLINLTQSLHFERVAANRVEVEAAILATQQLQPLAHKGSQAVGEAVVDGEDASEY
jgi:hypothetical protein